MKQCCVIARSGPEAADVASFCPRIKPQAPMRTLPRRFCPGHSVGEAAKGSSARKLIPHYVSEGLARHGEKLLVGGERKPPQIASSLRIRISFQCRDLRSLSSPNGAVKFPQPSMKQALGAAPGLEQTRCTYARVTLSLQSLAFASIIDHPPRYLQRL